MWPQRPLLLTLLVPALLPALLRRWLLLRLLWRLARLAGGLHTAAQQCGQPRVHGKSRAGRELARQKAVGPVCERRGGCCTYNPKRAHTPDH